jgi:hypothetical protein
VLLALFVALRIAGTGGDPSVFVHAGDRYVDAQVAPAELTVRRDSVGYDGQFVYRLALDPLTSVQRDFGIAFDTAQYRQQRIGLPALAWVVDRTTPLSTLWSILAVNVAALVLAAYAGARLAAGRGRSPLWALLLGLSPGLVVGLSRGLTEPLSWAALMVALWCWSERRFAVAGAALAVGVLTRETVAVAVAALGVLLLVEQVRARTWRPRDRLPAYLALALPTACYFGWQAFLTARWGSAPAGTSVVNLGVPVLDIARTLFTTELQGRPLRPGWPATVLWSVERVWMLALMLWAVARVRRTLLPVSSQVVWGAATAIALSVGGWAYDIQFLRAATEGVTMSVLLLIATPGRWTTRVLGASAAVTAVVAAWFVVHG